ncbi:MAG: nucleotide exchange factor GrpE [Clostridiales bacterium]|nr:nucleotide exchange factor GrpE [Clostridiales bacterium]
MSKKRRGKSRMNPQENPQERIPEEEEVPESAETAEEETPAPEAEKPAEKTEAEAAEEKAAEYLAMAQRIQADFENFRRRNESVRADSFAEGKRDVAAAMLPVLDNLERAAEAGAGSADEALKNGVDLVLKQMNEVYRKLDVTPIDRVGEKFDPNLENAILQGTEEDGEPGTVCQVLQKGYKMGDRILRHAMVKVVPE